MKTFKHILLIALLSASALSLAYDNVGHRIITDIAYQNISRKTRKATDKVLGTKGIVYQSSWADEVRSDSKYKHSYQWHYQNLKDDMTESDLQDLLNNPTKEGEHLFYAIETMTNRLKANKQDAEALKFLVHFIGDLHQPMHLGRFEDRGGNQISMKWFGKSTNLHSVWDGKITDGRRMSSAEYTNYLEDKYAPQKKALLQLSPLESLSATYELRTEIYSYSESLDNNYLYLYVFSDKLDLQLYRAGLYLANVLNDIYN